jgi:hypothetical protein
MLFTAVHTFIARKRSTVKLGFPAAAAQMRKWIAVVQVISAVYGARLTVRVGLSVRGPQTDQLTRRRARRLCLGADHADANAE